jgi:hypothetical protein
MVFNVTIMALNATFNNISVISWPVRCIDGGNWSPREIHIDLSQVTDKLDHIMLYGAHLPCSGFELTTLVVIGIDCIGSFKSN